jgi:hypothetical protein
VRNAGQSVEGRKLFFFEKRTKKLFDVGAALVRPARLQRNKSFLLLFFKKEVLALVCLSLSYGPDARGKLSFNLW